MYFYTAVAHQRSVQLAQELTELSVGRADGEIEPGTASPQSDALLLSHQTFQMI
jgi:hypothetical protein